MKGMGNMEMVKLSANEASLLLAPTDGEVCPHNERNISQLDFPDFITEGYISLKRENPGFANI